MLDKRDGRQELDGGVDKKIFGKRELILYYNEITKADNVSRQNIGRMPLRVRIVA